jgi:hypothetical protein
MRARKESRNSSARNHARSRRLLWIGAPITVAVLLLGVGSALATIPASDGTITACYGKALGLVRIIDASNQKCTSLETKLTWSQAGPQGNPGPAGPTGPAGTNGTNGKDGSNGKDGTNGTNGTTILTGTGAPADTLGNDGDFYLDQSVSVLYGPKTGGSWPTTGTSLVGPKGDQGPAGPSGASNVTAYTSQLTGVTIGTSTADVFPSGFQLDNVPAGFYLVNAQLNLEELFASPSATPDQVSCAIDAPYAESAATVYLTKDPNPAHPSIFISQYGEITLVGSLWLTGETNSVNVSCSSSDGQVSGREMNLTLLKVDSLTYGRD